jgi:type II secretory pathway pseudopilin PulG
MMKPHKASHAESRGFALVVTLTLMVLLSLLAVGMLSLSTVSLRRSTRSSNLAEARANARLALMVAIGALQKEMGPDMRVSAESALLDTVESTERIDGVEQSRWLGSYDSWGAWLNAGYAPPGGSQLSIQDTYGKGRSPMFRRWLLSLPEGAESDPDAPRSLAGMDPKRLVVMVGEGTLGDRATSDPDQVTKAYLVDVGERGRHAWWIGAENQRAKATLAQQPRRLAATEWESSQGDTAEVGVGALDGFGFLDSGADLSPKLVSNLSMEAAGAERAYMQGHFFDVTTHGKGVVTSVRSGRLKKDLSLLFEKPNSGLPAQYRFNSGDVREPSIRPMSPDLLAKNPTIPNRHFASWTNMRHYYRMYRQDSDATPAESGGGGALGWNGSKPSTGTVWTTNFLTTNGWNGSNNYWRIPILAKLTFIYSLISEQVPDSAPTRYLLYMVYSPVLTYWNPYNTELVLPNNMLSSLQAPYKALPVRTQLFLGNNAETSDNFLFSTNLHSFLNSDNGSDIVFKPGEIRLFSHNYVGGMGFDEKLYPGFDPQAIGGMKLRVGSSSGYTKDQNPGVSIDFSHSVWGGNINFGNTPGSLVHTQHWGSNATRVPLTYNNDWFQVDQTYTPITGPEPGGIARWTFTDTAPLPVAFVQLAIKGQSAIDYESIDWEQDWRTRNWMQAPPFYYGNMLYISEDDKIAQTQRVNNPYVMHFGPTSQGEMPKVVGHVGSSAFLGSGSNPFEKVTSVATLELPTAPIGSLAGLSGMRINPGWVDFTKLNPDLRVGSSGSGTSGIASLYGAEAKAVAYQSGVTGPGIGNSFMHPMLPRGDIYRYYDNSKSQDPVDRSNPYVCNTTDNKVFNDFWDHVFLLNDALWDDYFVSSLADQTRPGASAASSLEDNIDRLVADELLPNSRYKYYTSGESPSEAKSELQDAEGYLKAAKHLMVDGMFNVNSPSVAAWHALFAGIRERKAVYRDASGVVKEIAVPAGKRIALTRFNTEVSDKEMDDPETGETMPDGSPGWSGVRFLDDDELEKLAEECVKQVKLRGPFLNFSEFVNRRLSDDALGTMGALQSAIDYDDASPDPASINYRYKNGPDFMLEESDLGTNGFATPEAAEGSRFAGIPGYVIQSDLLKPIANTLSVRDDTFRIRACGESLDAKGNVVARAWCEAIVQRYPEYCDGADAAETPVRELDASGSFVDSGQLGDENLLFGRRFRIVRFRWLGEKEI